MRYYLKGRLFNIKVKGNSDKKKSNTIKIQKNLSPVFEKIKESRVS